MPTSVAPHAIAPVQTGPTMSEPLRRFLTAARSAGVRISSAESIDAMRAVEVVGFADKMVLRDSLSLLVAKSVEEKQIFNDCFELYFQRNDFTAPNEPGWRKPPEDGNEDHEDGGTQGGAATNEAGSGAPGLGGGQGQGGKAAGDRLAQMLLADDRAGLAQAMEQAAEQIGLNKISFFTQTNLYTRRIMERMGVRAVEREIEALRRDNTDPATSRADALETGRERLRDRVRDFVERNLLLFAKGENEKFREELLKSSKLTNMERRDMDRMRVIVRAIAKKLAEKYGRNRKKKNRGQLDTRKTIRRNMAWESIPFITIWKQKKIDKPKVMVLCDVSGSVAAMAQFLLLFLYTLSEALSNIRSFAFAGNLIEVSEILEKKPIEEAITQIMMSVGFGSSNYGNAFLDFEEGFFPAVDSQTTVIILGDARGNYNDPRTDIVQRLSERAKRLIWLNPEYKSSWGTGDSDMFRYAPYCHILTVCNTIRHLENIVTDMLKGSR